MFNNQHFYQNNTRFVNLDDQLSLRTIENLEKDLLQSMAEEIKETIKSTPACIRFTYKTDSALHKIVNKNLTAVKSSELHLLDKNGSSLLHYSAIAGNFNIMKFLVENGADINSETSTGNTPLHFACINNNLEVANYLIDNKANINEKNNKGQTPLHYAIIFGCDEIKDYLIAKGANTNSLDKKIITIKQILIEVLIDRYNKSGSSDFYSTIATNFGSNHEISAKKLPAEIIISVRLTGDFEKLEYKPIGHELKRDLHNYSDDSNESKEIHGDSTAHMEYEVF